MNLRLIVTLQDGSKLEENKSVNYGQNISSPLPDTFETFELLLELAKNGVKKSMES